MSVKFRQAFHDTFVRTFCPSRSSPYLAGSGGTGNSRHRSMSQSYASMYSQHAAHTRRFSDSQRRKQAAQQFDSDNEHDSPPPADRYMLATAVVVLHPVNIVTHGIMKNHNNNNINGSANGPLNGQNSSSGHKIMFSLIQEESEISQTDEHLDSE